MRKSKRLLALAMGMTLAVGMTACGSKEAAPRTTAAAAQDSQAKDSQEDKSKDSAPAGKEAAPAASETTYNWKWGTVDSTSNPNYEAMEYFCTLLDEKAPGKWSIQTPSWGMRPSCVNPSRWVLWRWPVLPAPLLQTTCRITVCSTCPICSPRLKRWMLSWTVRLVQNWRPWPTMPT